MNRLLRTRSVWLICAAFICASGVVFPPPAAAEPTGIVAISATDSQRMWIRYPTFQGTYWDGKKSFALGPGTYLVQGLKAPGSWDSADMTVNPDGTVTIANHNDNLHRFEIWGEALPKESALIVYNGKKITASPRDDLKSMIEGAGSVTEIKCLGLNR